MGLFGSKKKTAPTSSVKTEKSGSRPPATGASGKKSTPVLNSAVLVRPRITEKAANMTAVNVYTFDITARATKRQVVDAVKALYKVTPIKVNVVNTPAKKVKMRRKRGFGSTAAGRKAYVFLKKGEEIQFT